MKFITTNDNPEYFYVSETLQIETDNILMVKTDISELKDKNLPPISMRTTVHLDLQETKRKLTFAQHSDKAHPNVQNTIFLFLFVCFYFVFLCFIPKFSIKLKFIEFQFVLRGKIVSFFQIM